jgi:hypothetical protein
MVIMVILVIILIMVIGNEIIRIEKMNKKFEQKIIQIKLPKCFLFCLHQSSIFINMVKTQVAG